MSAVKTFAQTEAIPERSTYLYRVALLDANDVVVPAASVVAIALTLRDLTNNAIVNSRSAVSVKNANGGTLVDGQFSFQFTTLDMAALGAARFQPRLLTLDITLTGSGRITREVFFWLRAFVDVPD